MRFAFIGQSIGILPAMLLNRTAFGPLFLKYLGASDTAALLVFAIPGLLFLVQVPLSLAVPHPRVKAFLLGGWTVFGVLLAAAAVLPWWVSDPALRLTAVASLLLLSQIANAAAATFWFPLLNDIVPAHHRGRFFGRLRASWGGLLFCCTAASAFYLGASPSMLRFQMVLLIGVLLVFVRNGFIAEIPVSKTVEVERLSLRAHLRYLFRTTEVRRFLFYFALIGTAAGFLGQPLVLYLKDLGFHARDNMLIFGFSTVGTVIALLVGGSAIDRWGTRMTFKVVHVAVCLILVAAAGVGRLPAGAAPVVFSLVFILAGAATALSGLACTTHLFCFVPPNGRVFYLTVANFMLTAGPSGAMFVTGEVLRQVGNRRTIVIGGTDVGVFALLLLFAAAAAAASTPLLAGIGWATEQETKGK